MGKNTLSDVYAAPRPVLQTDNLFLLDFRSGTYSIMLLGTFLFSDDPKLFRKKDIESTYSSLDFNTQILLNEVKIIIFQTVIKS